VKTAIIGCGAIGAKRAQTMRGHELVYAADINLDRARRLCEITGSGQATDDWRKIIASADVELVVVSATNNMLAPVAAAALLNNKHVLIEKPAGRNLAEIETILAAQDNSRALAKVGFNHRFHPSLRKAKDILLSGETGEIMFIRGRYGHGGRLGYEKEWRFNRELSGGGELLDQGVHLIDLSRWLMGEEFVRADGYAGRYYWDAPLEDNAFMQLLTEKGQMAWLHVSATEWKNMFSMEIYCKTAKLQIDGLGGSYGTERLTYYKMLPEMGPPETTAWEYPFPDNSWQMEIDYFTDCIRKGIEPEGNLRDARQAMQIVGNLYEKGGC
jgi:predicted dehydrogenase